MMWSRSIAAVVLLASGVAAEARAIEDESKLACLLRPSASGLDERELSIVEGALNAALKRQQVLPTSPRERDMVVENEGLERCQEATCLDRVGRLLHVQSVVTYQLSAREPDAKPLSQGPDYEPPPAGYRPRRWDLGLTYYNVSVGAISGRSTAACIYCTLEQATLRLAELLTQAINEDAARERGELDIATTPSGATVLVDGIELGTTPYHRQAYAGRHEVSLRLGGFQSRKVATAVQPQQTARLQITLAPSRDEPQVALRPARYPRPGWRMALGGTLLGLGLGGIGGGVYGLTIDGLCLASSVIDQPVCIGSLVPGAAFTIAGSAAALAGVLMIAIPGPRSRR